VVVADVNAAISGFLRDLAYAQSSEQKAFGYKRAAAAIFWLEQPLTTLRAANGTLPKIPGIGPASTRVILEVLETGGSPTAERMVAESGKADDIRRRRTLRANFLSRAAVVSILADPSLEGPRVQDYGGDLQMHSEWSDGSPTMAEIARGCADRGYRFAAVTDHSHGLKIAGGMSMADAAEQHREIDRVNAATGTAFRLIKGVEANIDREGQLDLSADEIAQFEIVLAAPHAQLRSPNDQTERMLRAIATPGVQILAHPRGRVSSTRAGVIADWDVVFRAAAMLDVAVELDGDPARQDLDHVLAARALNAGCLFALDSDAHTIDQLRYADTALAHARLAGIPPDRIVNCWSTDELLEWADAHKRR
jgi:histidinol phosphatase-like PHP family hydrolase